MLALDSARSAQSLGDRAAVDRDLGEVDRLVRVARSNLASVDPGSTSGPAARGMLEAANYLEFIVGEYRQSGVVEFSLAQFAARELNDASSGAGGVPLNC